MLCSLAGKSRWEGGASTFDALLTKSEGEEQGGGLSLSALRTGHCGTGTGRGSLAKDREPDSLHA